MLQYTPSTKIILKRMKVKYTHRRETSRNSLNFDFGIKNERQDCEIGTVGATYGRGGEMEEMKVKEYG
jgi:hypothetical protein